MKYLLDTHIILWFFSDFDKLTKAAFNTIFEPANDKYASVVSAWELSIKISLGKLKFEGGVKNFIQKLHENGFSLLPVEEKHVCLVETLPLHHRDPFDRMLIAAAISENMNIITADANIRLYDINCVW